jgi:16S rRNA processing protein RimM
MDFITIGKIIATRGIKGKITIEVTTDFPQRFTPSSQVYVNRQPMLIEDTEWHQKKAVIKLDAINSVTEARKVIGQLLEIDHDQLFPLPEGQYYHFEIIGLEVRTTEGELLGNITDILTTPSNDNYILNRADNQILIPAIEDVIVSIEPDKGYITIKIKKPPAKLAA